MKERFLKSDPSIKFIERDAVSLKEVVKYIAGEGTSLSMFVDNGYDGLADNIASFEIMARKMQFGDKMLIQCPRVGSLKELPCNVLLDEEELRESGMRFKFLVRV